MSAWSTKRHKLASWLIAVALCGVGCGKSKDAKAGAVASGGEGAAESPEPEALADAWVEQRVRSEKRPDKPLAPKPKPANQEGSASSKTPEESTAKSDTATSNASSGGGSQSTASGSDTATFAGPSPWGPRDADTGKPLPKRKGVAKSAKREYEAGLAAAAAGDLPEARKALEAAQKEDEGSYQILFALGVVADRSGREKQAVEYYTRALAAQPDHEESVAALVANHMRHGRPGTALKLVEPLAREWERNLAIQAIYADVLTALDRPDDAIAVARKALRRDEKNVAAMLSLVRANLKAGRLELVDSILEQALAIDDKNAQLHYYRGQRLLDEQRQAEALAEFRQAVELSPDYAEARMQLALLLLRGANYGEALQQLQAVERLVPKQVEVQLALGDAYRCVGDFEQAKVALDKALKMQTELPQAHYELALVYMGAGATFPGLDLLSALGKAKEELGIYRSQMGTKLAHDDPSIGFLADIDKSVAREQKRLEREKQANKSKSPPQKARVTAPKPGKKKK